MKEHFSELMLMAVLLMMLGFVVFMGHVHNDSLASKGVEFAGQALAALLTLMVAGRKPAPDEKELPK
jgi:hypothetical protein